MLIGFARLILLITVLLAMANGSMARMAMPMSDAMTAVICINGAAVEVVLDADGAPSPLEPATICDTCPVCALTAAHAPTQPAAPGRAISHAAFLPVGETALPPHGASLDRAHARGPPQEQKNI